MRRWAGISVSTVSALAAVLLAVPAQVGAAPAQVRASAPAPAATKQPVAMGTGGAVASMDLNASQAGITVLRHGGNAIDAAVATASALGVTIPFVAGPGGGGFMVIYLAKTHQVVTIDGRENCPAGLHPHDVHRPADRSAARLRLRVRPAAGHRRAVHGGHLGQGGPAATAASAWPPTCSPRSAWRTAGFRVDADFQQLTESELPELQAYPASRCPAADQRGPAAAGRLPCCSNPDLAKTYQLLARYGPSYLYNGPLGPGHRAGRRPPGDHARADRGPAAGHHDHERPARLPGAGAGPDPRQRTAGWTSTAWRRRRAAAPPSARR